jgi:hypothetical protein
VGPSRAERFDGRWGIPTRLKPETEGLLERIDAEIANPSVRFGGIVQRVTLQGAERSRTLRPRTRFWTIGSDF